MKKTCSNWIAIYYSLFTHSFLYDVGYKFIIYDGFIDGYVGKYIISSRSPSSRIISLKSSIAIQNMWSILFVGLCYRYHF